MPNAATLTDDQIWSLVALRSKHQVGTDHRWAVALAGQRQTDQLEGQTNESVLEHSIFSRSDPWGRNLPDVGVWNLPPGTHLAAGRYIGVGKGYRLRFQSGDVDHRHRLCRDRTHPRDVDVVLSV